jgi:RNA polymerase sigma-70 factor, ECF subfamily
MPDETHVAYRQYRGLVFSIAYQMLGTVSDAEDVVQEAFLRFHRTAASTGVDSPRAFLATVATRLSIDVLRSARVQRDRYVGTWLPEPLPTDAPDVSERVELADSLSYALLVVLEALGPVERAVFLLREVFDYDFETIADMVDKTPANCRQLASRARRHVRERNRRFDPPRQQRDELVRRFFAACEHGDIGTLVEMLAADAVFVGDGGGQAPKGAAVLRPVNGRDNVVRLLAAFGGMTAVGLSIQPRHINGELGALLVDDHGRCAAAFTVDIAENRIQTVRSVVNPQKLWHLGPLADLDTFLPHARRSRRGRT